MGQFPTIQDSGQRAADVVSDLLTVARGIAAPKVSSNLNILIQEYLASSEYQKLKSLYPGIILSKNLDQNLLNFDCSPVHIGKSIMNLVTNAAEAIPGSGKITISTQNVSISNSNFSNQLKSGEYVHLSVSDTGQGIPEENLNCIFEPFFTKKKMGRSGTGLGLAIVLNTVKDHDGDIKVESNHQGTTFNLYFPATGGLL